MPGHQHLDNPSLTQNQGNLLGDRPCVRQSRLYREHVGGNTMKELMGQDGLKWNTTHTEGVYAGGRAFDCNDKQHVAGVPTNANNNKKKRNEGDLTNEAAAGEERELVITIDAEESRSRKSPSPQKSQHEQQPPPPPPPQQQQQGPAVTPVASRAFRPGAGYANRQTYNIFTGE
ncbi:hypothetical protein C3747_125g64 [Trypanosoma cruzi]|uniref:Uncharacterized protein n=2 Tax=Trypanosoma cruzi TaxID=5693 RepID=Q4DKN8_TRYCC|nr:hypothetical protein, conserved [Trypanosoma cruzi]EAN93087.1 hypothetical protein, conserved [Trypanosoma cruzi]PWV05760.1 hypothetical protein C3747_125g64 [Trypanosoma cruzi]RNC58257.1 hypothetical protein TcCL_ESM04141 [Trypanosoma cruzi]|eukprot:XP_814938.1 hypothetical protein [Trypanosoma cruzi strain CL Brener]